MVWVKSQINLSQCRVQADGSASQLDTFFNSQPSQTSAPVSWTTQVQFLNVLWAQHLDAMSHSSSTSAASAHKYPSGPMKFCGVSNSVSLVLFTLIVTETESTTQQPFIITPWKTGGHASLLLPPPPLHFVSWIVFSSIHTLYSFQCPHGTQTDPPQLSYQSPFSPISHWKMASLSWQMEVI